ncbi:ABC transporter substrate-binding protein [Corynebacterium timonense]|uniref:Peptide/nickel transport system substrate-binding protein n=1 Tax=Corynebacterium timonense TaxID=441500 RepID=A0A1H1NMY6_9CORY|nr:ABC transporter substrate-binding protein [Corynebacterium timonense]SDR99689.1 peptide/nickel transport system substrate-binding protein [Corynebacterium timonense]
MNPIRAVLAAVAVGALVASLGQTGTRTDGGADAAAFGYQLGSDVTTTNAGTMEGASQLAHALSSRLYPGVFVPGPSGQMIPNTDLATTQVLPGAQRQVVYTLAEDATFSDGTPVTCTDYLLAFKAGQMPELFGSHMPLFSEVEELQCAPGSKEFTVVFAEGGGARWRGLFGAGTVVPAHAVAQRAGISPQDLGDVLASDDVERLRPVASAWRDGFSLDHFDPSMQVSFGPYMIDSVGPSGEVELVANDEYPGDAPRTPQLVVWPASADPQAMQQAGVLRVAELTEPDPEWIDVDAEGNPYDVTTLPGELTDSLTFSSAGPWAELGTRRAFSACVDQQAAAQASSQASGVEVAAHGVHLVSGSDPLARRFGDIVGPHMEVNLDAARAADGMEVRVGYAGTAPRSAAMIDALRASCEQAGVRVVDAGGGKTLRDLTHMEVSESGEEVVVDGSIDVLLRPVDSYTEYPGAAPRAQDLPALRGQERAAWDALDSLPLAVQPRAFAVDRNVGNVVVYTGTAGLGWNMDRWQVAEAANTP